MPAHPFGSMKLYSYAQCSTCSKAIQRLKAHGHHIAVSKE